MNKTIYDKGKWAESITEAYYHSYLWKTLAKNYRILGSEIDLILIKNDSIVFVEVKYRKVFKNMRGDLDNFLTKRKKKSLLKGAQHFLSTSKISYRLFSFVRF